MTCLQDYLLTTRPAALEDLSELRSFGYALFPLAVASKVPRDVGWRSIDYGAFDHEAWLKQGGNVGIRLTDSDLVIDVDPRHSGVESFKQLCSDIDRDLGAVPNTITGRGDGGRHLFLKKPAAVSVRSRLPHYTGIDFKTAGGFVVAPGSRHPDTRGIYRLDPDGDPLAFLSQAPSKLLDLLRKPEAPERTGLGGEITPEQLEILLSALSAADYGHDGRRHDEWIAIAAAAHDATGGHGLEEWLNWCATDPAYGDEARALNQKRWESFSAGRSGGVTYKTLLKAVVDAGRPDLVAGLNTDDDDFADEDADIEFFDAPDEDDDNGHA